MSSEKSDLTKVAPPKELTDEQYAIVLRHIFRRIAGYRNTTELYAEFECNASSSKGKKPAATKEAFAEELNQWAQETLRNVWLACREPGGKAPTLDAMSDTSTAGLPALPPNEQLVPLLNAVVLLHVTAGKHYCSRTRTFLFSIAPIDEEVVAATLKNPQHAVEEAAEKTEAAREQHAQRSSLMRKVGMGSAAVAGGVLIGVTGGLAAPAVGAGVTTVLGWLGVGGTAAGMLASGLAGSSIVCGTLFGAYGSKQSAEMVGRYTQEVRDLEIKAVNKPKDTMAARLCVSGWLDSKDDITAPWKVFGGDDTFALQFEVEALKNLSNALTDLIKSQAMQYVQGKIIEKTVLASLFAAMNPTAWLNIGKIIDNPWTTARTRASKAGQVLGTLIAQRVLGRRPLTLVGFSLGSLVIYEALTHLAALPPSETHGLIQDVYLFGAPVPTDTAAWGAIRRLAAGRVVNGYGADDYVLAVLARASGANWGVAGLRPVAVPGVESVACAAVDGHLKWRGLVGKCLLDCAAPGVRREAVREQVEKKARKIAKDMDMDAAGAREAVEVGPGEEARAENDPGRELSGEQRSRWTKMTDRKQWEGQVKNLGNVGKIMGKAAKKSEEAEPALTTDDQLPIAEGDGEAKPRAQAVLAADPADANASDQDGSRSSRAA